MSISKYVTALIRGSMALFIKGRTELGYIVGFTFFLSQVASIQLTSLLFFVLFIAYLISVIGRLV